MQSMLSISPVSVSPVSVIQPQGHLNAAKASELQQQLTEAVLSSHSNSSVLVDLSQVESLDSAGLMALVSALSLAQRLGRRFSLCSLSSPIKIIFELTQLDRVFEIFESRVTFEASIL